jgi:hypothetical protein
VAYFVDSGHPTNVTNVERCRNSAKGEESDTEDRAQTGANIIGASIVNIPMSLATNLCCVWTTLLNNLVNQCLPEADLTQKWKKVQVGGRLDTESM